MSEYIEFTVASPDRFAALQQVFAVLKHDKDANNWRSREEFLKSFDDESLRNFYWPPDDMRRQRLRDLETRPVSIAPTEQTKNSRWDFDSLLAAFKEGEYILVSCEMTDGSKARLEFYSLAYPYGGVGCMVALVEVFEGVITAINDGTGLVEFP